MNLMLFTRAKEDGLDKKEDGRGLCKSNQARIHLETNCMKKYMLATFISLLALSVCAQTRLADSRKSSLYTYIYRMSPKEAAVVLSPKLKDWEKRYLNQLVDSFLTDRDSFPKLDRGNYLLVKAERNQLVYSLHTVDDLQVFSFTNGKDLMISLHKAGGHRITNANLSIRGKSIKYDPSTACYLVKNAKRGSVISIENNGVFQKYNYHLRDRYSRKFWVRLKQSPPLKYLINPIARWMRERNNYSYVNYFNRPTRYENKFNGFMVFDKPVYRPGDTVRVKAYIVNKSKHPVNRPLLLRLTTEGFDVDSILTVMKPYAKGGYESSFVLNDSLDLTLDDEVMVSLEELSSRKYDVANYEGDLDDEEYAAKRKILIRGKFYYEEYELNSLSFKAKLDKKEYHRGEDNQLILKATDENGLPVLDGRVQVIVAVSNGAQINYKEDRMFIPDTLWQKNIELESTGETRVSIPASIFPEAELQYTVTSILRNSNNELRTETNYASFFPNTHSIEIKRQFDSLVIQPLISGKKISAVGTIRAFSRTNSMLNESKMQLPGKIAVNPFVEFYSIETDSVKQEYKINDDLSNITVNTLRTRDSLFIQTNNPTGNQFWYTLFRGKKIVKRGFTENLDLKTIGKGSKNYYLAIHYVYGNRVIRKNQTIDYRSKELTIETDLPRKISPGQSLTVNLQVKDAEGKPVENADITAYAITSKFENYKTPFVPYLGKLSGVRMPYKGLSFEDRRMTKEGSKALDWARWSREMKLDTIDYFKFLFTPDIFLKKELSKDSITQIAPFVLSNHSIDPVIFVYVDEVPVYYRGADQINRYSFGVSPGRHSLKIRTRRKLIILDSIWAEKRVKTFIGINSDTNVNKSIVLKSMPDTLTNEERAVWTSYLALISNDYRDQYSYIVQNGSINSVYTPWTNTSYKRLVLVGPLLNTEAKFIVKDEFERSFEPEGNSIYSFKEDLVKQQVLPTGKLVLEKWLYGPKDKDNELKDEVLTIKEMDSLWKIYLYEKSRNFDFIRNPQLSRWQNGRLVIQIDPKATRILQDSRSLFLLRYDNPDFIRVYKGRFDQAGYQEPGYYRMILLLKNDDYILIDSMLVKPDGVNFYRIKNDMLIRNDTVGKQLSSIINKTRQIENSTNSVEVENMREVINSQYLDSNSLNNSISGRVLMSKTNEPIAGVVVILKGTSIGTITNSNGVFYLRTPPNGRLELNAVGFDTKIISLEKGNNVYEIHLVQSERRLQEVVVMGYGMQQKKELTASIAVVNQLEGRVAGLTIRGISSSGFGVNPLIVIDGVPFEGNLSDLDVESLGEIKVLKTEEAVSLYGSRASSGAIVITSNKNGALPKELDLSQPEGFALRRNFRDNAYWQPSLRTNKQGSVRFRVKFPDDITNWRNVFIAVAGKKTGLKEQSVKSMKSMSATIAGPAFLVEGDSAVVIGKLLNYGSDTSLYKRTFKWNERDSIVTPILLSSKHIDSFSLFANKTDSLRLHYAAIDDKGNGDGEERAIPIFKRGVSETTGLFLPIQSDTSFQFQPDPGKGPVTIYAESSVLPVLLDEIERIRDYEYLCNEQMASKLKALLLKKKAFKQLQKQFSNEKNIVQLIESLQKSKSGSNLWGWWQSNDYQLWISLHVLEALLQAEAEGYKVKIDKQAIINFLVFNLESDKGIDKLGCLQILDLLKAKVDYIKYISELKKHRYTSQYEKLQISMLEIAHGGKLNTDSLFKYAHYSVFGNVYFGNDSTSLFDNSFQNSILVYKLLKRAGGYDAYLKSIRNYLLEMRKSSAWRNTYESSLIIETIMPDLIAGEEIQNATISIGEDKSTVFPIKKIITDTRPIKISTQGKSPIYFTAHQTFQNEQPRQVEGLFTVKTSFKRNDKDLEYLRSGEEVILQVSVTANKVAEYVMIEVPIPAGCSYKSKEQSWINNEVHREYFKNKVSIFCANLPIGTHQFTISLLPRYTGNYILNPAKAEMMYFPLFYGRTDLKKLAIK